MTYIIVAFLSSFVTLVGVGWWTRIIALGRR